MQCTTISCDTSQCRVLSYMDVSIMCRGVSALEGSNKGDCPQEKLVGL